MKRSASPHSLSRMANRAAGNFHKRHDRTKGLTETAVWDVMGKRAEKSINRYGSRTGMCRYMDGESGSIHILFWKQWCLDEGNYYGKR